MEITFCNTSKNYGTHLAVDKLNFTIKPEALHFILGPSGCGKTTTLRMLAGLEDVSSGSICFNGKNISQLPAAKRGIGMVFQNYALWPHMTVKQNIEYGLHIQKLSKKTIRERLEESISMTHLSSFTKKYPSQLSGGQQQRVALARALAIKPYILLLDEPLSNLDAQLRLEMRENITNIHRTTKLTTVYVTHDQKEALSMGTHVTVMNQGKEVQTGEPRQLYESPKTKFLAKFIGETNLINGTYKGKKGSYHIIDTEIGLFYSNKEKKEFPINSSVCLSIRTESVKVKTTQQADLPYNYFPTKITHSTYLGELEQLTLQTLTSKATLNTSIFNTQQDRLPLGSKINCFVEPQCVSVLPP